MKSKGRAKLTNARVVQHEQGHWVAVSRSGEIAVVDDAGRERERYKVPYGASIQVQTDDPVEAGQVVANWDPHTHPIITEVAGNIRFKDVVEGVTVQQQTDEVTGLASIEVMDVKQRGSAAKDLRPIVQLLGENGEDLQIPGTDMPAQYVLSPGAILNITDGSHVGVGDVQKTF